jgi:hypothetical protein
VTAPLFDWDAPASAPANAMPPSVDARTLARTADPHTSHDAAEALTGSRVKEVQDNIRSLFAEWGEMSDVFLVELYRRRFEEGIRESTVRTRRHELAVAGELCDSGKRTANRRPSIIWKRSTDVSGNA